MSHKIKLKDDILEKVLNSIDGEGFSVDGCTCGLWSYPIAEDFHIYAERNCRKGDIPSGKWWHVGGIEFYRDARKFYRKYNDVKYLNEVEVDEEDVINVELDAEQERIIMDKLKEITEKDNNCCEFMEYQNKKNQIEKLKSASKTLGIEIEVGSDNPGMLFKDGSIMTWSEIEKSFYDFFLTIEDNKGED